MCLGLDGRPCREQTEQVSHGETATTRLAQGLPPSAFGTFPRKRGKGKADCANRSRRSPDCGTEKGGLRKSEQALPGLRQRERRIAEIEQALPGLPVKSGSRISGQAPPIAGKGKGGSQIGATLPPLAGEGGGSRMGENSPVAQVAILYARVFSTLHSAQPPRTEKLGRSCDAEAVMAELDRSSSELDQLSSELDKSSSELDHSSAELDRSSSELGHSISELDQSSSELDQPSSELHHPSSELDQSSSELDGPSLEG